MLVSETMRTDLVTVNPTTKLSDASQLMSDKKIRHLPVIDEDGTLLGIVTDRDMRDAMPSSLLDKVDYEKTMTKILGHTVEDIMTRDPFTISGYFTIQDTLMVIQKKKVGALPVVDEEGKLTGIMSTRDLLSSFVNIMGIGEPGTLLCLLATEQTGQMKKIIDVVAEENVSLGSVLVARYWNKDKRAIFPYLLTNNVVTIKKKLVDLGFEILEPMQWYLDQLPKKK